MENGVFDIVPAGLIRGFKFLQYVLKLECIYRI